MREVLKNWLPITVRNRVALGFAVAALVLFVTWNFIPYYKVSEKSNMDSPIYERDGYLSTQIWPIIVDPDIYLYTIKSPSIDRFFEVAVCFSFLLSALLVMTLVPLWEIIHASKYLTIPLGVVNFFIGSVFFWSLCGSCLSQSWNAPYEVACLMIPLSMLSLAAALFIFKNELELRHEREVKKTLGSIGDSR